jgi:exodeoxyribonuclease VIII
MSEIMLDLETMGTASDAAIIAIGAVAFSDEGILSEFYATVDLQDSVNNGLKMDPATVMWWLQQSSSAREQFAKPGNPLVHTLEDFSEWVRSAGGIPVVWGNGADFDNVILGNAYLAVNKPRPWSFWNNRCYRTLKSLAPNIPYVRPVIAHHALHDARAQALHLIEINRQLTLTV